MSFKGGPRCRREGLEEELRGRRCWRDGLEEELRGRRCWREGLGKEFKGTEMSIAGGSRKGVSRDRDVGGRVGKCLNFKGAGGSGRGVERGTEMSAGRSRRGV